MRKLKGKDLMIFVHDGTNYQSVACSLDCDLCVNENLFPVLSDKAWDWESYSSGMKEWTMGARCYVNNSDNPLIYLGRMVRVMIGSVPDFDIPGNRQSDGKMRRYGDAVVTSIREVGEIRGKAIYTLQLLGSGPLLHDAKTIQHLLWVESDLWFNYENWMEQ